MAQRSVMDLLRERAEDKLNDATLQLGKVRQTYEKARAELTQLQCYQQEYQQELVARKQGKGLAVTHLLSYQFFINSLNQVVEQCSVRVASCEDSVTQALSDWKNDSRRLNAFTTLKCRADDIAKLNESRQEQKLMDEFASQIFLRKKSA
ncbi:flagellar FliJ protein [Kosakonia arachidis]|uniref:Flagellar FliJ protein n=2 Tax=Kosakonia arachidis TaxID=551989 RepID=A0A1I7E8A3_9ENTR|nr:flagellar FliJ protein [Kosakonia arachidis]